MIENKPLIVAIDDQDDFLESLQLGLEDRFKVIPARTGQQGLNLIQQHKPDLVLMDLDLPGLDGARICEVMRSNPSHTHIPVIFLSGYNDPETRTRVFRSGADDFVAKPFTLHELIVRIDAKLKRNFRKDEAPGGVVECGNLMLNSDSLEVTVNGKSVVLTVLEFRLLSFLVAHEGSVLSRQKILKSVWKDSVVTSRTIDTHIAILRRKLAGFDRSIRTIYGAGYVLRREQGQQANDSALDTAESDDESERVVTNLIAQKIG